MYHFVVLAITLALLQFATAELEAAAAPRPKPPGVRNASTPVAPRSGNFMWQTVQNEFLDESGGTCDAQISIAIADQAVCYVASTGDLRCAGRIFETNFGPTFVSTGQNNVDQIMLSPTFNHEGGNAICIRRTNGTVWCMGDANGSGQFGNGTTGSSNTFQQWGSGINLKWARIGTGTFDQICAIERSGLVFCSGFGFGATPVMAGSGSAFWMDTFGVVRIDDPSVFRAAAGRTVCRITSLGLSCTQNSVPMGTAGEVVDGSFTEPVHTSDGTFQDTCWLSSPGTVHCQRCELFGCDVWQEEPVLTQYFTQRNVVGLARNPYTDSMCAVHDDGSIWCIGSNASGKLGTGHFSPLAEETMVQPAGSVSTRCR